MIAGSGKCQCLSPGTAELYDVNPECTHGVVAVHARALAIERGLRDIAIVCVRNHHDSLPLPVSDCSDLGPS